MIDILFSTLPLSKRPGDETILGFKKIIFRKIVDEEEPRLTRIAPLIASLREEIETATL